jgi:hypothetical protein
LPPDAGVPSAEARPSSDSYFGTGQSFGTRQDTEAVPRSDTFGTSTSFGSQQLSPEAGDSRPGSEPYFLPERPSAESQPFTRQPPAEPVLPQPAAESLPQPFAEQEPFTQQPFSQPAFASQPFASQPFATQPEADPTTAPPAESEQEKTGPIVPVGAAQDSETTGPIRPVRTDGPAGWTLPGT